MGHAVTQTPANTMLISCWGHSMGCMYARGSNPRPFGALSLPSPRVPWFGGGQPITRALSRPKNIGPVVWRVTADYCRLKQRIQKYMTRFIIKLHHIWVGFLFGQVDLLSLSRKCFQKQFSNKKRKWYWVPLQIGLFGHSVLIDQCPWAYYVRRCYIFYAKYHGQLYPIWFGAANEQKNVHLVKDARERNVARNKENE